jgi:hypothetical protein
VAIKRSRVHHVVYRHDAEGLRGLALAIAAIVAAMPRLVDDLQQAPGQRLVDIQSIRDQKRYKSPIPSAIHRHRTGLADSQVALLGPDGRHWSLSNPLCGFHSGR